MSLVTELPRPGGFLISEAQGERSRHSGVVAAVNDGATIYPAGTVVGEAVIGSQGAFAILTGAAGTTCGTITPSAGVKEGVYTLTFLTGASATAEFAVVDPQGLPLPSGAIGSAYSHGGLAFTLTDAGSHPAVGDQFAIMIGTGAFANGGADTGDGTCSAIKVDPGIVGGTYTFTAIDATHFSALDPFGNVLSELTVGTAYKDGGLEFTITPGGTAYVAGDTFTITTYTGSDLYAPVSSGAADGTQFAAGVLIFPCNVGGASNVPAALIVREAEVDKTLLVWPSGATQDQILNWQAQLAALQIIARSSEI